MEYLAGATSVRPCGHSFCFCCLMDWTAAGNDTCPTCQTALKDTLPQLLLDGMVEQVHSFIHSFIHSVQPVQCSTLHCIAIPA
jgi:hypothetical protein